MGLQECGLNINHSKKELQPHGTLEFPCAGYTSTHTNDPRDTIPWHWHEEIEIIYIKKGTLTLQIPSTTYVINEGDCAVINTNILKIIIACVIITKNNVIRFCLFKMLNNFIFTKSFDIKWD